MEAFKENPYPDITGREELANLIQVSQQRIQVKPRAELCGGRDRRVLPPSC